MRLSGLLALAASLCPAATFTVKAGGGGDYTTIQACATAMANGDTCTVFAGTYNEHVTLSAGGVASYKTLQVNGTDVVNVLDFVINSHDKIIGFHIQNPSSPASQDCIGIVNSSTDIYITSNNFYACGNHAMISGVNSSDTSSHVFIQRNTFSYSCSTTGAPNTCRGMNVTGDHDLVENNDLSHVSDGINIQGSHHILRNNTMHDTSVSECGSHSGNCHIDFIESEPAVATQFNLYESNTLLNNLGADGHGYLAQGDACAGQCSNLIIRFNVGAHVGSGGILDDNAQNSGVSPGFFYVKSYNNTWVDFANTPANQPAGITNGFSHNSTHGAEINDLFYYPQAMSDFNPYATDASTVGTFAVSNNLAYCTAFPCNLHGKTYGSGSFTSDPGNIQANPQFVNYAGNDFRLANGSPALNGGTYLATVAAGDIGSGTSLVVNDASFFQDGSGIAGVNADCISVRTVGTHACIMAVNYSTNTLTMASGFTRSAGDHVWLYSDSTGRQVLIGGAPNMGATFQPPTPISVCASGCTTTSLQTALDSLANCGDTIQIKSTEVQTGNYTISYRGCTSGTPITVTSDRAATYLVNGYARVTPSQLANMAILQTTNSNPALRGVLDGMNRPPAHWKFIGIGYKTTGATFDLIGFNVNGEATNSSMIADDITFDRSYAFMASSGNYAGFAIQDMIRGDVTNLVVKNTFFGDGFFNGYVESHGPRILTSAGPAMLTNNFITTSTIPIFVGGSTPSYPAYLENGLTAQYNYFWRPYKYNGDPAQPFAADYAAWAQNTPRTGPWTVNGISNTGVLTISAGPPFIPASLLNISGVVGCTVANANNWRITSLSGTTFQLLNFPGCNAPYTSGGTVQENAVTVCTKNLGEAKWGTGVTWQYNAGENSWESQGFCQSQWNGFTNTLRTQWDSNITNATIGAFAMSDTTHITWTGTYRVGTVGVGSGNENINDNAICLSLPTTGTECHPFTSFSGASLVTTVPFSAAPGGALNGWFVYTGSAKLENVTISHNAWKNVDSPLTVLALSYANGVGDAGFGKTHTISQNLAYANTNYITGFKGFSLSAAESDDSWAPTGYTFDHNTFYYPNGLQHGSFVYLNATQCSTCATAIQPKFTTSAITNNLFGVSSAGGNGPFSGDSFNNVIDTTNAYFASSNIKNNAIPGGTNGSNPVTGGNAVSGNQYQSWIDPFGGLASSGIFTVVPASMYYHAGTDGASLGADFTALPLITNLSITAASTAASLGFTVAPGINDIKNTQVCVLEVSTSRNLQSDLGTYSVIASLDPTVTPGADLSTQSGVTISSNNVTWAITGLVNATLYYGRLMCYGDTEWFSFSTGGSTLTCSPKTHISPPTVTDIQLQTNMALGTVACTNNITQTGTCNTTDVQRVVNAALGGACVIGP